MLGCFTVIVFLFSVMLALHSKFGDGECRAFFIAIII
nr:MAG TPA: hypothetical protein [Caudoviricetes sp.]